MDWGQFGGNVLTGGVQTGMGILTSYLSNKWAAQREKDARKENFQYNELAANAADQRTRNLYLDLQSPQALLNQYKSAGLSPALMYGGSGASGQVAQGAQGGGAAGISPTSYGISPVDLAQIKLMNAQTNLVNEKAKTEGGTNERGAAEIKKILTENGLNNAATQYTKLQSSMQEIQNELARSTQQDIINKVHAESENAANIAIRGVYEIISAEARARYDEETLQDKINSVTLANLNTQADTLLKKSNIKLNDAEIAKINAEIQKWTQEVAQGWANVIINNFNAETHRKFTNNINDYWDDQIKNLNDRLEFDKSKFDKEMKLEWSKFIGTLVANSFANFGDQLIQAITLGMKGGRPKINGL